MTTDRALAAIKAWIESRVATYPVLTGIPILLRDTATEQPGDDDESDEGDFDATFILLNDASSAEHPVLRGVLTMEIEALLKTAAGGDLGKTDAEHAALNTALYNILADKAIIPYCDARDGFTCFDVRGVAPVSESGDGMRTTTFTFSMVGAAA